MNENAFSRHRAVIWKIKWGPKARCRKALHQAVDDAVLDVPYSTGVIPALQQMIEFNITDQIEGAIHGELPE